MKTYTVIFSGGAREDILEISSYIASKSSRRIADAFVAGVIQECNSLGLSPYRGTSRRDLRPNMRVIGHKRATSIIFRVEQESTLVVILAVLYRGQSYEKVLERND